MSFISRFVKSWRWWGGVMSDKSGEQIGLPAVSAQPSVTPDRALQLSAVYACAGLLANTIASFPIEIYRKLEDGTRTRAEDADLWFVLHDSPNALMTPMDFWRAMITQLVLRGNAYAKIERNDRGKVVALFPLASDQMSDIVEDGKQYYVYTKDGEQKFANAKDILHLKGMGSGFHGFSKLEFMASTLRESGSLSDFANGLAATANKPAGIVKVSHMTDKAQREGLMARLSAFKSGDARFLLIDGDMEFSQVSLTPQESQILETRQFGIEEICRWFGVPPQLIGAGTTASWGNGIAEITAGFEKYTISPIVAGIEQAISQRLMTIAERRELVVEFSMTNLLKQPLSDRASVYSTMVQNGIWTRNQCRGFEGMPPIEGGDDLTAQTSLAPLSMLGKTANNGEPGDGRTVKQ